MKTAILRRACIVAALAATAAAPMPVPTPVPTYAVSKTIAGPDGFWDYASVDPASHQLFVAHADTATVIDLATGVVKSVGSFARSHAVVPVPAKSLLAVTSGQDNTLRLLDMSDWHEAARIAVGQDPDAALLDPSTGQVVVMNAKSGTVSLVDLDRRAVTRTIKLKPALEFGVVGAHHMLFVNNEDANEIESANLTTGAVGRAIAMPGCEGPTGLGYDARTGRLISACANGKAVVIDTKAHRVMAMLAIGKGPDAVIMDPARRLAFIPCGRDGTLAVIALDAPGGPKVAATVKTEVGARTGAIDPTDGALYLPAATYGPMPAGGGRPTSIVAGSFHIVVVSPH